jgi:hypothetical protein
VLVLYNADWKESGPFLDGIQGSRAVAEHYVRMHTDPVSGDRPYMLGLTGKRFLTSLLAGDDLEEESGDNGCGVVYQAPGSAKPLPACDMRDSRLVEVALPKSDIPWDTGTLRLVLEPASSQGLAPVVLVEKGRSLHPRLVKVQQEGEWQVRALGKMFMPGAFTARLECADARGHAHTWRAKYHDIEHIAFSATGADGVRDDSNYLDCVENPVKRFLQDPSNARPDGTLLKDHILYFVLCYGLPRTVAAPFGIATGITDQARDFGSRIDLGQRLQLMYYDMESLRPNPVQPLPLAGRAKPGEEAFRDYVFRASLALPLMGGDLNPFVYPGAYHHGKDKTAVSPPRFTSASRAMLPERHLFFVMRIDGESPEEAMELVDRGVYASCCAGPAMGVLPSVALDEDPVRTGRIEPGSPGSLFWLMGYRHLFQHPRGWVRLELFKMAPGTGFLNADSVFLPGGVAAFVQSNQGWNVKDSRFLDYLRQGVTVTAGSARVEPQVTPHIHSHSFWDEDLLFPLLFQGYPIGEILLANQIHLNWITSFVGDPLFRLPLKPKQPPGLSGLSWERNVRWAAVRDPALGRGRLVMADLGATPRVPRLAQMRLVPAAGGGEGGAYVFARFSSRPRVFVPDKALKAAARWRMELMDPFGVSVEMAGTLERQAEAK